MKKTLLTAIIALSICTCGKKNIGTAENETIIGKWKLTQTLSDPGDGSGKWQPADPNHPSYIEFRADDTLAFSTGYSTRYKLLSDSTLILYSTGDSIRWGYQFTKTQLTLHPPCIEACGMRYAAVH
jgi:hypothetical protein